jgi:hypothetical protein
MSGVREMSSEVIEAGRNASCRSVGLLRGIPTSDSNLRPYGRLHIAVWRYRWYAHKSSPA